MTIRNLIELKQKRYGESVFIIRPTVSVNDLTPVEANMSTYEPKKKGLLNRFFKRLGL